MEQYMWIVLDSLPNSWEHERKVLVEKASNLKYNEILMEWMKNRSTKFKVVFSDLVNQ